MLFVLALLLAPALAAFFFQLICYASYQKGPANSSLKVPRHTTLQNA